MAWQIVSDERRNPHACCDTCGGGIIHLKCVSCNEEVSTFVMVEGENPRRDDNFAVCIECAKSLGETIKEA